VGLFFLGAFLLSTGFNTTAKLVKGDSLGRLAVVLWPILLIYNVTESMFFQIGTVWFAMLLVTIDSPLGRPPSRATVGVQLAYRSNVVNVPARVR
jgi:hypothetical protein